MAKYRYEPDPHDRASLTEDIEWLIEKAEDNGMNDPEIQSVLRSLTDD